MASGRYQLFVSVTKKVATVYKCIERAKKIKQYVEIICRLHLLSDCWFVTEFQPHL